MKSVVELRISDSVLEDDDWPIVIATVVDGRIVALEEVVPGVYTIGFSIGTRFEELLRWLQHNPTGDAVEQYNEIRLLGGKWEHGFDGPGDGERRLKAFLENAIVG